LPDKIKFLHYRTFITLTSNQYRESTNYNKIHSKNIGVDFQYQIQSESVHYVCGQHTFTDAFLTTIYFCDFTANHAWKR